MAELSASRITMHEEWRHVCSLPHWLTLGNKSQIPTTVAGQDGQGVSNHNKKQYSTGRRSTSASRQERPDHQQDAPSHVNCDTSTIAAVQLLAANSSFTSKSGLAKVHPKAVPALSSAHTHLLERFFFLLPPSSSPSLSRFLSFSFV